MPQTNRNWSVLYGKIILAAMQEKFGKDFHPVFIEHTHNLGQQLADLENFLIQAKGIAQTMKDRINLSLIIADDFHWRTVQIQIYPGEKAKVKIFFMSSIAKDEPENFDLLLSKQTANIFGNQNTNLYINMLPLQKDGISCRLVALKIARMFHSMLHGKYKAKYPKFDLFDALGVIA